MIHRSRTACIVSVGSSRRSDLRGRFRQLVANRELPDERHKAVADALGVRLVAGELAAEEALFDEDGSTNIRQGTSATRAPAYDWSQRGIPTSSMITPTYIGCAHQGVNARIDDHVLALLLVFHDGDGKRIGTERSAMIQ